MATLCLPEDDLITQFGPHAQYAPPGGWNETQPDRLVKTHCCFCGVQCGIQLKVKDNAVIGFEPWEEFPVNRGKLCPKGIKRYMQNGHPDRLLHPLVRSGAGFRACKWDEALGRTVEAIRTIQARHGRDAFALLGGASMTNEKVYLLGKFARVALGTANIDYNGRLCMVSAASANKMAFGIDRAANPWSDIPLTKLVLLAGTNLAECFPILTDHVWEARDRGAKIIVVDPRLTPIARTADLFLPVRPGRDAALAHGILHLLIRYDWIDHKFIEEHTTGFETLKACVLHYDPETTERITGVPKRAIIRAAEMWHEAESSMLMHARGIEHHTNGTANVLSYINIVLATGRIGRPGCGYGTITGQGNGQGGREHGMRCNQLPGGRDVADPIHRREVAEFWGIPEAELPKPGLSACEIFNAIEEGKIKGLLSISFNPLVSIPDAERTRKALEKLEFFACIEFFMSETARHADVVLAGSLQEEDEGTVTNGEGRCIRLRNSVSPPADARVDWKIIRELAERLEKGTYFRYEKSEDIFNELARASRGAPIDYSGMTYSRIEENLGLFWPCPSSSILTPSPTPPHPGTLRLFEDSRFYHEDGRARFHTFAYRPPDEDVEEDYPIILTTGRVVSQYLSGTQTRRIGALVDQYPEPLCEMHPRLAEHLQLSDGETVRVVTRRGTVELPLQIVRTIRPDTIFIPYHWPGRKSANRLTNRALDPISKIPEFKVCSCRVEKAEATQRVADSDMNGESETLTLPSPLKRERGLNGGNLNGNANALKGQAKT